jgi:hypothetical protein
MNKKIPIRIIVVLSFAVAEPMSIGFLAPTPRHNIKRMHTPISSNTQSDLTFPGSNIDDDGPTITLTFHDKGHYHQSIFKTIQD